MPWSRRRRTPHPGKIIYGVGPTMVFPTATCTALGQGKVSFGPTVVALMQPRHGTFGFLINNAWSVVGSSHRPSVNQMTLQYFANYILKKTWYFNTSPILTVNWHNRATGGRWTLPFGAGVGRVTVWEVSLSTLASTSMATPFTRGRFVLDHAPSTLFAFSP